ncbi:MULTISPECIES: sodium/glutamate symporter [Aneurinibacillus]|uniref:Glutamate:Na+ symporter, ESS family n=1 Tax=Aneurinibacillus thermoaerophilus TaxID=143495 RepID=A0A1G7XSW5_ANETH|nr:MULTISPECIES: sodium/glutamate symporter [Aneurinibacillus]AMA73735.1 sodium:glutamate symporter [Aneurinibacillus sp. XH2]MED0677087.1 sodium/glutamate symporter [Aneurinibacillus thermoaerophilus]MED0679454.1 sodium/glutamate symporter [Aneurinibacillus thermoaerophilus]MED0737975.1 sodium/glutamate symporter [Aneurinibacillus thermoaerophilus]MED0756397.1 sodium/glutamate symporter [Aneurinibacillus thermoaerophilus]
MFPTEKIQSSSMETILFYCAVLGILLFIGVVLRVKVKFFKKFFISASLIAGTLGLLLGQYGLGVLPAEMTESWGALPGALITVVFAPMLMGVSIPNPKKMGRLIVPHLLFGYMGECIQIALPFIITGLVLIPVWNVNEMFGSIVEIGWSGGHGTAGGMVDVYNRLDWSDGGPLGLTSATVGLLVGIIVGMVIINYGVRKGYTSVIKNVQELNVNQSEDILPRAKQPSGSAVTMNKDVVESLAFHGSLISIAILIGWVLQKLLGGLVPGLPLFPMAMVGGLVVQLVISKTKFAEAIDTGCLHRIQGLALEFLIMAAIASIKIPVVIEYAFPLSILMVVMTLVMVWYFFWAGPRLFGKDWFEHAIVNYGSLTGVTAVALMLLRTVDPEMKTEAGTGYALRAPFISPIIGGGLLTSILPVMAHNYGSLNVGVVFLILLFVLYILARRLGFWTRTT